MKLIFCPECQDVFRLTSNWRMCMCSQSGGQYDDRICATIGGKARVFGIANPFFSLDYLAAIAREEPIKILAYDTNGKPIYSDSTSRLQTYREEHGYGSSKSDVWWGEFDGDTQITRIKDADGPNNFGQKVFTNKHKLWWMLQVLIGRVNYYSMKRSLVQFSNQVFQVQIENEMLRKEVREWRETYPATEELEELNFEDEEEDDVKIKEV